MKTKILPFLTYWPACLLIAFAAILCQTSPASERAGTPLLQVANWIPGTWDLCPAGNHDLCEYFWLSNRSVLVFSDHFDEPSTVGLLDTNTGQWSQASQIGPGLNGEKLTSHNWLEPLAVSPDCKWMLCLLHAAPGPSTYQAISLTSRKRQMWPAIGNYLTDDLRWLPDGKHWFYWDDDKESGWMQSLGKRESLRLAPSGLPHNNDIVRSLPASASIGPLWVMGVTPKGKVIAVKGGLRISQERFTFYSFDAKRGAIAKKLGRFLLSEDEQITAFVLSPKGDRMAWILEESDTSQNPKVSLWTGSLDGTHRHMIGETHIVESNDLTGLQWTPDGMGLSFICSNRLWTVPAQ